MTRDSIAAEPCVMGGHHVLTAPQLWDGTSCRKCHRTWEGPGLVPTWPAPAAPRSAANPGDHP